MQFMGFSSRPATELFTATRVTPLDARRPFLDVQFSQRPPRGQRVAFQGCGLYAIAFRGRLIYVGKFRGLGRRPFAGNILNARWKQHLSTLTLRGVGVGSKAGPLELVQAERTGCPMLSTLWRAPEGFVGRIGFEASENRLRFASRYWDLFKDAEPAALLEPFSFTYVQLQAEHHYDTAHLREAIGYAEDEVTARLRPLINSGHAWVEESDRPEMAGLEAVLRDALKEHVGRLFPVHPSGAYKTPARQDSRRKQRASQPRTANTVPLANRDRIAQLVRGALRNPLAYRINDGRRDSVVTISAKGKPVHVHIDVGARALSYKLKREGDTAAFDEIKGTPFEESALPELVTQWCP